MKKFVVFLLIINFGLSIINCAGSAYAQEWMEVHYYHDLFDTPWMQPYKVDQVACGDFSEDGKAVNLRYVENVENGENGGNCPVMASYYVSNIDSITFSDGTPDSLETHNKYKVFTLSINTEGAVGVHSKEEYVPCYVSLNGRGEYANYSGHGKIRGRGNSTWEWYDKKPYRLKLDVKHKMLGLGKNKDWVLLANFRDPTDLMNAFVFEVADWMGMPYVNNTRFVEVFLDGDYIGLYQLTEQVEQGKTRVDVADEGGILLGIDADDGPSLSPSATDNFWSPVFSMPICVKYPDDPTEEQVDSIRELMRPLEQAISDGDYDTLDSLMDMRSFMTMALLQEYVENVELCAPRSVFMYKDAGGKWAMGPFWDWDAGYDFDWGYMYKGHKFFGSYKELILGSDPAKRKGMYGSTPRFFTAMFNNARYNKEFKALWNSVKDSILVRNWQVMERYMEHLNDGPYDRDFQRWPITDTGETSGWNPGVPIVIKDEIQKMYNWLEKRTSYLDGVINDYPVYNEEGGEEGGGEETTYGVTSMEEKDGGFEVKANMCADMGYTQTFSIDIDKDKLITLLGVSNFSESNLSLVPLNSDGSEGSNTAAGTYGAWFDDQGDTNYWGSGHVFIESNDLYSWGLGCHPDNCEAGHTHTISMQYKYRQGRGGSSKKVTVKVVFSILD